MRRLLSIIATAPLWACSVPDKQPLAGDAGVDAPDTLPGGIPDTQITSAPDEFSATPVSTFEFRATTAGAHFTCSFDGEPPAPCTSPAARTLADGTHSFSVRAIGPDGKSDATPAEHLWMVDTVAPITTITEAPPPNDNSTMVHFSFISNEMYVTFECSLDEADFVACRSGDLIGPIADGTHNFWVRARDRANNVDDSPAVATWSVDTSTPDTTLLSGPIGSSTESTATFTFESPDAGAGATFECSLDGAGFAACTSPATYSNLPMAVHTFAVRVRDATGNVDPTPATRTWTIDLTPPETTITSGPSGTIPMASASITFTSNETDVTFACSLDGAAATACTSPYNAIMLSQGAHTFSVAATDMAGQTDATPATATWTVDTTAPTLAFTGGPDDAGSSGPRVAFAFTSSEGATDCRIDTDAWGACASPFAFNAAAGAHSFSVRATDDAGNTSAIQRNWTIACSAPDGAGASGLLHLDDNAQVLANATGGASATLGTSDQAETADPAFQPERFGTGLQLTSSQGDVVTWPLAAGGSSAFTFSFWIAPESRAGTVIATSDGRLAIRVSASGAGVKLTASVVDSGSSTHTVTSAQTYAANTWHQVVFSFAEPTLRLWVDGDRTDTGGTTLGSPISLDALTLGGDLQAGLDEVLVSQNAATADEAVLAAYCPYSGVRL